MLGRNPSYKLFPLKEEELAPFLDVFYEKGGLGLNITHPYKKSIARLLRSEHFYVNTLYRGTHGWLATNTDGIGFIQSLGHHQIDLNKIEKIVILGNGGASYALCEAILNNFMHIKIDLLRRNEQIWENDLSLNFKNFKTISLSINHLECSLNLNNDSTKILLIQATSAPLHGNSFAEYLPTLETFQGFFIDLNYQVCSDLYQMAKKKGLKTLDGLPMLIGQALEAQFFWWGEKYNYQSIWNYLNRLNPNL